MKTLKYFRYLLMIAFAATLMLSCSDEEFSEDGIKSQTDNISLRSGEDDWSDGSDSEVDCFVEVCVTVTPNTTNGFADIFTVQIPGVGVVTITNNTVTDPNGNQEPLVDNMYCTLIPVINGSSTAILSFKGFGGVHVTGEWENEAVCELFSAAWAGVTKNPLEASQEVELTCESPCPPPPDCFIDVCVTITPGDPSDIFFINYPTIGILQIANGIVTLPDGSQEPLVDNEFCATIPIFDPTTVLISYYGWGAAVVNATYENDQTCEVYSAGVDYDGYVHICQDVTLDCEPPCPPPADCFIEVCATITPGDVTDIYIVGLPNVGNVVIQNNTVTLPNGDQFPLVNNQFCTMIPIFDMATANLSYFGTGAVEVTAEWPNATICPIFDAGVGTDEYAHVCEEITLTCEPTCPPPPLCEVTVCAEFNASSATDIYVVQIPNVGNITITNGTVTLPSGQQLPLADDNIFCATIPLYGPATATLIFKGTGSVVTTGTWADGTSCQLFSAGVGTSSPVKKKLEVLLECDPPCENVETCTIEICANFQPADDDDLYQVVLPGGGLVTIQGGWVTLPSGQQIPYNGEEFCADIEIEVGTTETAVLVFKGNGEVVTTLTYSDGGNCVIFKAGQGTPKPISAKKEISLGCDPIC